MEKQPKHLHGIHLIFYACDASYIIPRKTDVLPVPKDWVTVCCKIVCKISWDRSFLPSILSFEGFLIVLLNGESREESNKPKTDAHTFLVIWHGHYAP